MSGNVKNSNNGLKKYWRQILWNQFHSSVIESIRRISLNDSGTSSATFCLIWQQVGILIKASLWVKTSHKTFFEFRWRSTRPRNRVPQYEAMMEVDKNISTAFVTEPSRWSRLLEWSLIGCQEIWTLAWCTWRCSWTDGSVSCSFCYYVENWTKFVKGKLKINKRFVCP